MALNISRSLRLEPQHHFPPQGEKSGIAIHHTVGGSAASSVDWWRRCGKMIGTAYVIERDGTVYEVFDPAAWAWQFGLQWDDAARYAFERRFIGIELASEGALTFSNGELYCFDTVSPRTKKAQAEAFDYGKDYRGYRYFDRYEPAQLDSLMLLVDDLCKRFGIQRQVPSRPLDYYGDKLKDFRGIIGHAMVRKDKSDPMPDESLWQRLMKDCRVQAWAASPAGPAPGTGAPHPEADLDALFESNVQQINVMDVASGSMIKCVIQELSSRNRNTYIRLHDAVPGGHSVKYGFVQGDPALVERVAKALGLRKVTADTLEVI